MAFPVAPPPPPTNETDIHGQTNISDLEVHGTIPPALSGRLIGIGPALGVSGPRSPGEKEGIVHAVHLHGGRAVSYRSRWVVTDSVARRLQLEKPPGPPPAGPDIVADDIISFGGSILALGHGSLAYELTIDLDTVRRVDLAGRSRGLAAHPKRDPSTGELHLLATGGSGAQTLVVVSAGAFTRTTRSIDGGPDRIIDLAITRDHVVLVADGFIGVTRRRVDAPIVWIATGRSAPHLVHAHDAGDTVVVHTLTPSLERWTLRPTSAIVRWALLDPATRGFARINDLALDTGPRFIWTSGDDTVDKHDLDAGSHVGHRFRRGRPSDLTFVADPSRPHDPDGGWLVGFVHHRSGGAAGLVVVDAADIAQPAIATVSIPRHVPHGLRSAWIPTSAEVASLLAGSTAEMP